MNKHGFPIDMFKKKRECNSPTPCWPNEGVEMERCRERARSARSALSARSGDILTGGDVLSLSSVSSGRGDVDSDTDGRLREPCSMMGDTPSVLVIEVTATPSDVELRRENVLLVPLPLPLLPPYPSSCCAVDDELVVRLMLGRRAPPLLMGGGGSCASMLLRWPGSRGVLRPPSAVVAGEGDTTVPSLSRERLALPERCSGDAAAPDPARSLSSLVDTRNDDALRSPEEDPATAAAAAAAAAAACPSAPRSLARRGVTGLLDDATDPRRPLPLPLPLLPPPTPPSSRGSVSERW